MPSDLPHLPPTRSSDRIGPYRVELWAGGCCRFSGQQWTNHRHRHPRHQELCLVLGGSGEFLHGDMRLALAPGDMFVSELDVAHEICSPAGRIRSAEALEILWCGFAIHDHQEPADSSIEGGIVRAFLDGHSLHARGCGHLRALVEVLREGGAPAVAAWRRRLLWRAFLVEGLAALCTTAPTPAEPSATGPVAAALDLIRSRLARPIVVAEIATGVGMSERHLRRLFQQELGVSVVAAIADCRLQQARRLLSMRFPVARAAANVGIADPTRFSRLFRRRYGETPRAYQAREAPRSELAPTEFGGAAG